MIEHGARRAAARSSCAAPTRPTMPSSTSTHGADFVARRRRRGDAGASCSSALDRRAATAPTRSRVSCSATPTARLVTHGRRAEPDATSTRCRFPAWDLVDVERYRARLAPRHGYFSMNMVTTRGCPYHCNWCAKPIWGQRYNVRSPENVVDELALAQATRTAPDHIWFADDIFGLEARLDRALRRPGRRRDGARDPVQVPQPRRPAAARRRDRRPARRRAAETVWIGAESGSQRILDAMEKGTRVEQIVRGGAPPARGRHRGRLLPAVRLPGRDAARTSTRRCSWCATARPTTSASRCRTRCRARGSTSASAPSSARSRTGSTPTTSR